MKGNLRVASERRGGANVGLSEHLDTILNFSHTHTHTLREEREREREEREERREREREREREERERERGEREEKKTSTIQSIYFYFFCGLIWKARSAALALDALSRFARIPASPLPGISSSDDLFVHETAASGKRFK